MTEFTQDDQVVLCPAHAACTACQKHGATVVRTADEQVRGVKDQVHILMRGWAAAIDVVPASERQMATVSALSHVLDELRGVVGDEGDLDELG